MTIEELQATYADLKSKSEDFKAQTLEFSNLQEPVKPAYFQTADEFNTYMAAKTEYDTKYRSLNASLNVLEVQIRGTRKTLADQITIPRTWFKIAEPDVWVSNNGLTDVGDQLSFANATDPATLPVYDL